LMRTPPSSTSAPGRAAGATRASEAPPLRAVAAATAATRDRPVLAEGPYVPAPLRIAPTAPSPRGEALRALVERKIFERSADPYR
jgi:hypothetical protein